jgi:hypothetical protein
MRASAWLVRSLIREAITIGIHVVVHLARVDGHRRVTGLLRVRGYKTADES